MKTKHLYIFYVFIVLLSLWAGWRYLNALGAIDFLKKAEMGQFLGDPNSKKILVEIVDYRCPPCRNLYPVLKEYHQRHPDVKIVVKYLPVYLKPSVNEARFALAAAMQGRFSDVHDRLMTRGEEPMSDEDQAKIISEFGLDPTRIAQDRGREEIEREIVTTYSAVRVLKVRAVPTLVIGNKLYTLDNGMPTVEDIEKMMDVHYGTKQK